MESLDTAFKLFVMAGITYLCLCMTIVTGIKIYAAWEASRARAQFPSIEKLFMPVPMHPHGGDRDTDGDGKDGGSGNYQ